MHFIYQVFLINLLLSWSLSAQPVNQSRENLLEIDEAYLVKLSQMDSPNLVEIQSRLYSSQLSESQLNEKYQTELFASASQAETNERPLIAFIPIFSPTQQLQLGARKKFTHGLEMQVAASTDQRSSLSPVAGRYRNVTTSILAMNAQIDLWKDLFGKFSRKENENLNLMKQQAELEKNVQEHMFAVSIRRLYWSIIANKEAQKISKNLLQTSEKQLADAVGRQKKSIADVAEVSRYRAQVEARKGALLYLEYQHQTQLKNLKNLIPTLIHKDLKFAAIDLSQTLNQVLTCTQVIGAKKELPEDFSDYPKIITLLNQMKSNSRDMNERYSDLDLKLIGQVKSTGVGSRIDGPSRFVGSYQDSFDDMNENNRIGYEVGLQLTIPLGETKNNSEVIKKKLDDARFESAKNKYYSQIESTHQQFLKSIVLLGQVIKTSEENSKYLNQRLKEMELKFSQARISVTDLINDQDSFLSSELNTIDAKLEVINTLFDYLSLFNKTPCDFNRI